MRNISRSPLVWSICAGAVLFGVQCSKDKPQVAVPSVDRPAVAEQGGDRWYVNLFSFKGHGSGSPFTVMSCCAPNPATYGVATTGAIYDAVCDFTGVTPILAYWPTPAPEKFGTGGSCYLNASYCVFQRGPNSSTGGATYYIIPSSGGASYALRQKLELRIKGGGAIPLADANGCAWFHYNASTNSWTAHTGASTYFIVNVVTTVPPITACC